MAIPTILQQLQQQQQTGLQVPGIADNTQRVAELLRARATGKALAAPAIAPSNIQEQVATQTLTEQVQEQVAPALAAQQIAGRQAAQGVEAQAQLAKQELDQTSKFQSLENRLKLNQIMGDLNRSRGALETDKGKASLEQATFLLSMQDRQYTDKLKQVGEQRRLADKFNLLNEMQNLVFGEQTKLLKEKIVGENILLSNRRDWNRAMDQLSVDDAVQTAAIEAKHRAAKSGMDRAFLERKYASAARSAAIRGKYSAFADLFSAGVGVADRAGSFDFTPSNESATASRAEQGYITTPGAK